jgi:hypothetical protein
MRSESKEWLPSGWRTALLMLVSGLTALWLDVAPVLAQAQQQDPKLQESKPAAEWGIGAVLIVGCLVVGFKNSKRSHVQ